MLIALIYRYSYTTDAASRNFETFVFVSLSFISLSTSTGSDMSRDRPSSDIDAASVTHKQLDHRPMLLTRTSQLTLTPHPSPTRLLIHDRRSIR